MTEGVKRCTKCEEEKAATTEFFYRAKGNSDGLEHQCRACRRARCNALRNTPEGLAKEKEYLDANREAILTRRKAAYELNRQNPEYLAKIRVSAKESARRQRKASYERVRATERAYADRNREARLEGDRRRRQLKKQQDPEGYRAKARLSNRKAYLKNPEKYRAYSAKQRAERLAVPGEYTAQDLHAAFKRQYGKCFYCDCKIVPKQTPWEADHHIPISKGGTNDPSNIVIACQACNRSKSDKWPWEFMPEKFSPPHSSPDEPHQYSEARRQQERRTDTAGGIPRLL